MCIGVLGPVLGAVSSLAQGIAASNAAKYNAKMAELEAKRAAELGAIDEAAVRRRHEYELGQQEVDLAGAGRSGASGSPLELAFSSAREAELDALYTQAGWQMRRERSLNEAALERAKSKSLIFGSALSAGGQFLQATSVIPSLH